MEKGTADRGVRTEDSGVVDHPVPVTDAHSGDEGIDDVSPQSRAEPGATESREDRSSRPPGVASTKPT